MRLRDRTIIAGVSVIAVVLLALFLSGTVSLTVHLPTVTSQAATTATSQTSASFQISLLVAQSESRWLRGAANDVPEYATAVDWSACNAGPLTANNTSVVVRSEGAVVDYESFPLPANTCHDSKVNLRYSYETATHGVTIEASSGGSGVNKTVAISVALPRILLEPGTVPSPELLEFAKLFITPNDPVIEEVSRRIFQESPTPGYTGWTLSQLCPNMQAGGKCPDWMVLDAIGDWVSSHVALEESTTRCVPGFECVEIDKASGYVHLPRETLQRGKGDAADVAVLIVSLARAAQIPSDKIFVVLGSNGTTMSAWLYDPVDLPYVQTFPLPHDWNHPCQCNSWFPECCAMRGVYYFNDKVVEMPT